MTGSAVIGGDWFRVVSGILAFVYIGAVASVAYWHRRLRTIKVLNERRVSGSYVPPMAGSGLLIAVGFIMLEVYRVLRDEPHVFWPALVLISAGFLVGIVGFLSLMARYRQMYQEARAKP